jgi:hypothetical protein
LSHPLYNYVKRLLSIGNQCIFDQAEHLPFSGAAMDGERESSGVCAMAHVRCCKSLLAVAGVLIGGIIGNSSAWALSLSGIPDSGSPAFGNSVKVYLNPNSGTLKITGKKDFWFDNGTDPLPGLLGNSAKYSLLANFDTGGTLLAGGTVSLRGGIDSLGIAKNTLLMTADLGVSDLFTDPGLWGFSTSNIWCNPTLLIMCTQNESVYVELDTPFGGFSNGVFKSNGYATTTVPIPASAWLFMSGLGLLYGVRRKANGSN